MAKIEFTGMDEMMKRLENLGHFDNATVMRISNKGAGVVLRKYKSIQPFAKYAKKVKSGGGYYVYPNGNTSSGYRAFAAAYIYENGRKGNGKQAYHKGAITTQKSRPVFSQAMAAIEAKVKEAMDKEFQKIMDELC